ncbi:MAG: hypothetical protein QW103_02230, partial [Candidatus Pacearchaeota archaeon]
MKKRINYFILFCLSFFILLNLSLGVLNITKTYNYTTEAILNDTRAIQTALHLEINNTSIPYNNLVAYYSFDADTNTTAFDLSGNNLHGSYLNEAYINTSCGLGYGSCVTFDGVDDKIMIGDSDILDMKDNDFFISSWVKVGKSGDFISKKENGNFNLRVSEGKKLWLVFRGADSLTFPRDITTDGTYLYIVDTSNHRIVKRYASNLSYVSMIGSQGSGIDQFNNPNGIEIYGTYIYIVDTSNHRIVKRYASNLSYVSMIGSQGSGVNQFNNPVGITTDGEYIYIADTSNHRIVKRYASNLSYVSMIGSQGSGVNQFNNPRGVATDGEYIYIADTSNHRIVKRYASNLSYVSMIGSQGSGIDQFNNPVGITTDGTYLY